MRKKIRRLKRQLRSGPFIAWACVTIFFLITISYAVYMNTRRLSVDPITYQPLLQLIADAESKDNYNAYFGNASNTALALSKMSVADVMQWQADYVAQGSPSDAVGRYQIISPTLRGLVSQLDIDTSAAFNSELQDKLAITLLEQRGSEAYLNNDLTRAEFAANLAKEWAALPKVIGDNPASSYYDGDGLNRALVEVDDILKAISPISPKL